jgi:hypothetical protein
MGWLYRILDIGRGVELAIEDAQKTRGSVAITISLFLSTVLAILFLWAWWTYDLYSTWEWAGPLGAGWGSRLPENLQAYNQWLIFALNALPTLIQWRAPRLARKHHAYLWAFAAAAVFDMVTDYPKARADVDLYLGALIAQTGLLAPIVTWGAYLVATVLASFVLQALFVIEATRVAGLMVCLGDAKRSGAKQRHARTVDAEA